MCVANCYMSLYTHIYVWNFMAKGIYMYTTRTFLYVCTFKYHTGDFSFIAVSWLVLSSRVTTHLWFVLIFFLFYSNRVCIVQSLSLLLRVCHKSQHTHMSKYGRKRHSGLSYKINLIKYHKMDLFDYFYLN